MVLLADDLVKQPSRLHYNSRNGIEQLSAKQDATHNPPTKTKRMLTAIHLGHYLAKEQQDKSQQNGHEQEMQPPGVSKTDGMIEEISKLVEQLKKLMEK